MQSATSKRLLSSLASSLHPQLPLSPRESQQLLALLTKSFRAQLDREYPVFEHGHTKESTTSAVQQQPSSHASASRHLDSILTNPLFAAKPHRGASGLTAVDVLRDPTAWFLDQIAMGSATLPKAVMCLSALKEPSKTTAQHGNGKSLAPIMAEWLRTSGTDKSREFVELYVSKPCQNRNKLTEMLMAQGEYVVPWRWFIRSRDQRIRETNLDPGTIYKFKSFVLRGMMSPKSCRDLNKGLTIFMRAFWDIQANGNSEYAAILKSAGALLVNRILSRPDHSIHPKLYQSFHLSSQHWSGRFSPAIMAILWLHHPTEKSAVQGLRFIQNPSGALLYVKGSRRERRFLARLCTDVARQCMEEGKDGDAYDALAFAKTHLADLVLPETETDREQSERNKEFNLELLDQLIPT